MKDLEKEKSRLRRAISDITFDTLIMRMLYGETLSLSRQPTAPQAF